MVQFLSINFFLGFLQFLLVFSEVPVFYVNLCLNSNSCHSFRSITQFSSYIYIYIYICIYIYIYTHIYINIYIQLQDFALVVTLLALILINREISVKILSRIKVLPDFPYCFHRQSFKLSHDRFFYFHYNLILTNNFIT